MKENTNYTIDQGSVYPYDSIKDKQDWHYKAARAVIANLKDRRGIKRGFEDVDSDIRDEIVDTLADLIKVSHERFGDEARTHTGTGPTPVYTPPVRFGRVAHDPDVGYPGFDLSVDYGDGAYAVYKGVKTLVTGLGNAPKIGNRVWEIWTEGYRVTGGSSGATLHGKFDAPTFPEAVQKWVDTLDEKTKHYFNPDTLTYWGCRFLDNEPDARASFG